MFQFAPRLDAFARSKQSVKLHCVLLLLKTAPTVELVVGVKVQVVVLLTQAPVNPPKVEPEAGVAVSVTDVPLGKLAEQLAPQLIPEGLETTVPLPVPDGATVTVLDPPVLVFPVMQFSNCCRAVSRRLANPEGSGVLG